uniref:Uncharacterized protein n=1 Tax=Tanacetum cinerariifolium TaxID=118510 RepID=A0A6L2L1C3_TANCI|nr:hypothetical protein [Tanacetum cinerariifolium]
MLKDSSEDLINFLAGRDPQWQFPKQTEEEEPNTLDVPMQTEAEDLMPLDIEEVVVVKQPYSLDKVTNAVLGLRAPKAEVECSGFGRKRNS